MITAWHTSMLMRQKVIPSIEELLKNDDEFDDDELADRLMAWAYSHNARYEAQKRLGIAED